MRNWLIYDGYNSKDYGIYISGMGTYNAPKRSIESITIPGRNGELTIDNGRYENIDITYPAFIVKDFDSNISAFRNMLLSHVGYFKLEDSYHPEEYRKARYSKSFNAEVLDSHIAGKFDITFNCYPQRFLKNGDDLLTFENEGTTYTLYNNEETTALPLLQVYKNGTLTINGVSITTANVSSDIYIDCELMEAYDGTLSSSANNKITLNNGIFPSLVPGSNTISFTGIQKLVIAPRWWRL